jgi:hypothetical protein
MPAIPESTRSSIILRLLDHAETNWPQLAKVRARYHGSFAYITGVLRNGEQIPLFRLRYGGSAHSFGFAIYSAARARYEDAVLLTGSPVGTPQEALDTACTVHLAGLGHVPPTNLRSHPLSPRPGSFLQRWRLPPERPAAGEQSSGRQKGGQARQSLPALRNRASPQERTRPGWYGACWLQEGRGNRAHDMPPGRGQAGHGRVIGAWIDVGE